MLKGSLLRAPLTMFPLQHVPMMVTIAQKHAFYSIHQLTCFKATATVTVQKLNLHSVLPKNSRLLAAVLDAITKTVT